MLVGVGLEMAVGVTVGVMVGVCVGVAVGAGTANDIFSESDRDTTYILGRCSNTGPCLGSAKYSVLSVAATRLNGP